MSVLLSKTEESFSSIANILLKGSGLSDSLALVLSGIDIHPILLAWLVAIIDEADAAVPAYQP